MSNKKQLGAFYTTNVSKVLEGFEEYVLDEPLVVDLYAGDGHLLEWAIDNGAYNTIGMDINSDAKGCDICIDTLLTPPNHLRKGSMVVINPPYLLNNKASDKRAFEKYGVNDLYKCSLLSLIDMGVEKGIAIIPTNFFTDNDNKFRAQFFNHYEIKKVVMYDKQMFEDTNVRVSVIYFKRGITTKILGHELVDTRIGKEYLEIINTNNTKGVERLVSNTNTNKYVSNINLYTTDTGGSKEIRVELGSKYIGKLTDRNKATLVFDSVLTHKEEKELIDGFNTKLKNMRDKYDSLFLTNFLAGKDGVMRKRLGFTEAYKLVNSVLKEMR